MRLRRNLRRASGEYPQHGVAKTPSLMRGAILERYAGHKDRRVEAATEKSASKSG